MHLDIELDKRKRFLKAFHHMGVFFKTLESSFWGYKAFIVFRGLPTFQRNAPEGL